MSAGSNHNPACVREGNTAHPTRLTALPCAPELCMELLPVPQAARNMGGYKIERGETFTSLQELGM